MKALAVLCVVVLAAAAGWWSLGSDRATEALQGSTLEKRAPGTVEASAGSTSTLSEVSSTATAADGRWVAPPDAGEPSAEDSKQPGESPDAGATNLPAVTLEVSVDFGLEPTGASCITVSGADGRPRSAPVDEAGFASIQGLEPNAEVALIWWAGQPTDRRARLGEVALVLPSDGLVRHTFRLDERPLTTGDIDLLAVLPSGMNIGQIRLQLRSLDHSELSASLPQAAWTAVDDRTARTALRRFEAGRWVVVAPGTGPLVEFDVEVGSTATARVDLSDFGSVRVYVFDAESGAALEEVLLSSSQSAGVGLGRLLPVEGEPGVFETLAEPGPVTIHASRRGYRTARLEAEVAAGPSDLIVELEPLIAYSHRVRLSRAASPASASLKWWTQGQVESLDGDGVLVGISFKGSSPKPSVDSSAPSVDSSAATFKVDSPGRYRWTPAPGLAGLSGPVEFEVSAGVESESMVVLDGPAEGSDD